MILEAGDLVDWVADRQPYLVAAWSVEIRGALGLEAAYAECAALEWHEAMLTCLLGRGTEHDFKRMVARAPLQIDVDDEAAAAERFYDVTLKLARAATRHDRYRKSSRALPYLRAVTPRDDRVPEGHRAIDGIVLPFDHPFWRLWCPPLDMECRASTIQMLRSELALHPVTEADELAWREARLKAAWPAAFFPLLDFRR